MHFVRQTSICEVFRDLIVGLDGVECTISAFEDGIECNENLIQKQNAYSMTLTDIIPELERRSLSVKGFFSDDAKTLQIALDKEHASYVETKKKEMLDSHIIEAQAAAERQKQALINESVAEEENAIKSSTRVAARFQSIQNQSCPIHCRIDELTPASARSLSKLLWSDTRLVSVDVSNIGLSDVSGAFLARALHNNTSLKKLEMGGNQFASVCCRQLAESLLANTTLNFLGLDSNPLCTGNGSKESMALFSQAIGKNTSLTYLSLWRCGLCTRASRLLADEIANGLSRLIGFEFGYNHFDNVDIDVITQKLESNRKDRASSLAKAKEVEEQRHQGNEKKAEEDRAMQKEIDIAKWLVEEEKARAEARRHDDEERKSAQEKEAQKQKAMEHARKMEDARIEATSKKRSKGKKGAGKKR